MTPEQQAELDAIIGRDSRASADPRTWAVSDRRFLLGLLATAEPGEDGLRAFDDFMEQMLRDEIGDPAERDRLIAKYRALRAAGRSDG